jgi:hypothetical protein
LKGYGDEEEERRRSGVLGNGKGSLDILCGGMNSVAAVEYFPGQNEVTKQSIFKCGERIGLRLWSLDTLTNYTNAHGIHFFFFECV